MCGSHHTLRTSKCFLKELGKTSSWLLWSLSQLPFTNTYYLVFRELVKIELPPASTPKIATVSEPTKLEEDALRYVAGYSLRKLQA